MSYWTVPVLILGLALGLTAAAIALLPETLYFPTLEYGPSKNIRVSVYKSGELDQSGCEQVAQEMENAIRANCRACKVERRCIRGLDAERRRILSRQPLPMPSARISSGGLTMTFSSPTPQLALDVCRQIERQTAAQPGDRRMHCFAPFVPR